MKFYWTKYHSKNIYCLVPDNKVYILHDVHSGYLPETGMACEEPKLCWYLTHWDKDGMESSRLNFEYIGEL